MKRRQEAAEEAERQRLQAEADAKAAIEAAEAEKARAEAASRDQADAPGSPQSGREHESGKTLNFTLIEEYHKISKYFTYNIEITFNLYYENQVYNGYGSLQIKNFKTHSILHNTLIREIKISNTNTLNFLFFFKFHAAFSHMPFDF